MIEPPSGQLQDNPGYALQRAAASYCIAACLLTKSSLPIDLASVRRSKVVIAIRQ
jgi:hypothetical protein